MYTPTTSQPVYESVYTALKELGIKQNEIDLYVLSLSIGPSPISTLAKHLHISRPNMYALIKALEMQGLAQWSTKERFARQFIVEPPSVVLEHLRKKQEAVARVDHDLVAQIPKLLAHYHQGSTKTKMKVFEGQEQFLKLFFQILDEAKDESVFCGSAKEFIGFVSWEQERKWIKERVKRNVRMRSLILPGEDEQILKEKDVEELRETRVLAYSQEFLSSFQIFGNKVIFWQPKAPLALLIEDEFIVHMMQSIFDLLWLNADTKK